MYFLKKLLDWRGLILKGKLKKDLYKKKDSD